MSTANPVQYVIIGNSAAGITAAKEIRRHDPLGRITVVSDERSLAYSRVMLPLFIAERIRENQMFIASRSFYSSLDIQLVLGESVEAIEPEAQRVHTRNGRYFYYDRLLIATGSSPRKLDIPGESLQGVHYLRRIADAKAIKTDLCSSEGALLVVGGGLVGVKSLEALVAAKRKAHLVVSSDRILSQMLDKAASDFFLKAFERNGVKVHLRTDITEFKGRTRLEGALLSDGTLLPCGMAIIGKGVNPNTGCATGVGIALNRGIIVDPHMGTNNPSICAAGDVVEPFDVVERENAVNAIWPLAVQEGRVAGSNMAGVPALFSSAIRMNAVEILGTRAVSAGQLEGNQEITSFRKGKTVHRKLVFSEGQLKGFVLAGDIGGAGVLTSLLRTETEVTVSALEKGLDRGFSCWPRFQILRGRIAVVNT